MARLPKATNAAPSPSSDSGDGEVKSYRVLSPVKFGGKIHRPDARLTLPPEIADQVAGCLEEIA